ncbi:hypothetical protein B0T14DRAFT_482229 [Immersiella caudata]|uniref:Protein kinase domain-containing protein n=1 Tax=Immersiella caudata TaxID=314043 RepID=A0AA39WSZ1_9PEZI|nr:hypothetical protein B0T14DRAFT_482229 [Immersiella caudata]
MPAELVLAVLGLVDGCIKLARKTITTCRAYCHAEEDLNNKVLVLEARWVRLETQLEFLKRIKDHLTDDLAQCHFDLMRKLHGTLVGAVAELEIAASSIGSGTSGLTGMFRVGRWKYALRKNLDTLMSELDMWQRLFDPSWYLILLIGGNILVPVVNKPGPDPAVDTDHLQPSTISPLDNIISLRQAIEREQRQDVTAGNMGRIEYDASQLLNAREERISYSTARAIFREGSHQVQIIEAVHIPASAASFNSAIESVEQLARKLQHVDPDAFGLLSCDGVLKRTELVRGEYRFTGLEVIYRAPSSTLGSPMTLRRLLLDQPRVSLSAIVRLATQLVRSVSYIHACDFVHKNIRPESILIFPSDPRSGEQIETVGNAFLLGLSEFRLVHDQTNLLGDIAWHRNLYRHPTRQGLCILEKYIMQHDIYALGVCLLEIGLWRTFVAYSSAGSSANLFEEGESDKVRWEAIPAPGFALELRRTLIDKDFKYAHLAGRTAWVKDDLVQMARRLLPHRMGDIYAGVVVDCLTCLDEENEAFGALGGTSAEGGDEKEPDGKSGGAGITVGVRFVESILAKVAQISV